MKKFLIIGLTAFFIQNAVAQPQKDCIYSVFVKSIEVYKTGNPLNNPVIALLNNETIDVHFDMLDNDIHDFRYELTLCDRNWNKSSLHPSEYVQQFGTQNFEQIDFSVNTNTNYIHYSARFPNENMKFLFSGNYLLQVFDNNNDELLFQKRIIVIEQLIKMEASVQRSDQVQFLDEYQEVLVSLFPLGFPIRNPLLGDISVQILQNHRWDNAITAQKPTHITADEIRYAQGANLLFLGNAEFHQFNFKSFVYPGGDVRTIEYNPQQRRYNILLFPNENRNFKPYSKNGDLNGGFTISHDFVEEANTLADYANVIFTYKQAQSLYNDEDIFVIGGFSMWQPSDLYKMTYNEESQQYEASILLKQGYYDYLLAEFDPKTTQFNSSEIEGSYYQTENDYEIFVYFYDTMYNYDRVICYKKLNSVRNDN
ncbi:MAG: DUF5103 domain-containing protein [Bacteroidales bacterium]|jgi:hypothetical protein|nr:DUF5103 domain-containing protein [Bacteroidales bacterium]